MGMAGLALWSLEHPEVERADLVAATERMVRGLLSLPAEADPYRVARGWRRS